MLGRVELGRDPVSLCGREVRCTRLDGTDLLGKSTSMHCLIGCSEIKICTKKLIEPLQLGETVDQSALEDPASFLCLIF